MSNDESSILHLRFRQERLRLGFSHQRTADVSGFSRGSVISWEQGTSLPARALEELAAYGMDVQFVITGIRSRNVEAVRTATLESGAEEPELSKVEWKLLRDYRSMGDLQREQAQAMMQVLKAGLSIGGSNVIGTGGITVGRDIVHGDKIKRGKQ